MKIIVKCNECQTEKRICDAKFNPVGELEIVVDDCPKGCDSCEGCEDLEKLKEEKEKLQQELNALKNNYQ